MSNNDILRRIRYTFNFDDSSMIELFQLGGLEVTRAEVSSWLKKEDDPEMVSIYDKPLSAFLNGWIIRNRGRQEGIEMKPEKSLDNNATLRKIKIALNLKDTDMLELLDLAGFRFSKHELSALFRKPGQDQYKQCKDQVLRNFLYGMQLKYRPKHENG